MRNVSFRGLGALFALGALMVSSVARAQDATPPPATTTTVVDETKKDTAPPDSTRWPLLLTGVGFFGASYGIGAAFAATSDDIPGSQYLYIPVAGPWIAIGENGCRPTEPFCDDSEIALRDILYVVSSLTQMGGLGLIAQGIFLPTGDDEGPAVKAAIIPMSYRGGSGVGVVGTF